MSVSIPGPYTPPGFTWTSFADKTAFTSYHDQACTSLGIPKPGQLQSTGVDALGNQWTTAWVRPVMDGTTIKALVPDADVVTYHLTPATPPLGSTSKTSWDSECDKPLPSTWNGKPVPSSTKTTTTTTSTK